MTEWIKQGVCGDMSIPMRKGHGKIVKLYTSKGLDFYTTAIRDGNHSPGSLHPDGNAEDFRGQNVPISEIKEVLGPDFDVINERDHYHAEYDPKNT